MEIEEQEPLSVFRQACFWILERETYGSIFKDIQTGQFEGDPDPSHARSVAAGNLKLLS